LRFVCRGPGCDEMFMLFAAVELAGGFLCSVICSTIGWSLGARREKASLGALLGGISGGVFVAALFSLWHFLDSSFLLQLTLSLLLIILGVVALVLLNRTLKRK
jgi:hypothetical protein